MAYSLVEGDIFESDAKYIAHQCNCTGTAAGGIAGVIFKRYPYADIYSSRKENCIYTEHNFNDGVIVKVPIFSQQPGNITIHGDGEEPWSRFIINMLSQYNGGGIPSDPDFLSVDGPLARQKYFIECLLKIAQIEDLESIAFPYKIGCAIAGGDWAIYEALIKQFAEMVEADVYVYRLPGVE